jgi:hypothetical protein
MSKKWDVLATGRRLRQQLTAPAMRGAIEASLAIGLVGYFAYHVWRFRLDYLWPLEPRGDSGTQFAFSRQVWESGYPPAATFQAGVFSTVFPYPPAGVFLFNVLGLAGPQVYTLVWWALMFASLAATLRIALLRDRLEQDYSWLMIGALALVVADNAVAWDLHYANNNLIYLGLILVAYAMLGSRPVLAGILIGVSISLKIYSVLLLPWLLFFAPRRALVAAIGAVAVLWFACPLAILGPDATIALYSGWLDQHAVVAGDWGYSMPDNPMHPPLVTVRRAAMMVTGGGPFEWQVNGIVWAALAGWLAALAWYARRWRPIIDVPSRAALADLTVILLAPLPLSPWLEPYHTVPNMLAVALCIIVALDERAIRMDRWVALGTVTVIALDRLWSPIPTKGFDVFARFLLLALALSFLRPRLARRAAPARTSFPQPHPIAV